MSNESISQIWKTGSIFATPAETLDLGLRIGETLRGGEVILLKGDLGAGKTLLTKGILGGLGFNRDEVTSPSFALVNLYRTPEFDVYHVDLWRLQSNDGIEEAIGLAEILENEKAIVVIEWAEKISDYWRFRKVIEVEIQGIGEEPRSIRVNYL